MLHQRTCKRVKSVNSFCKFILALLGKGVPLSFTFDENSPPSVNHPVVRYYLVTHTGRRRGPAGHDGPRGSHERARERCLPAAPAPLPAPPRRSDEILCSRVDYYYTDHLSLQCLDPGGHSSILYSEKGPTKFPKDSDNVVF